MGLFRLEKYSPKHSSAGRFWGFNRIKGAEDGKHKVYMTRAWIGRLRLHIFHRGDQDPDCHDHPWGFWTFPLRSYREEVLIRHRDTVAEVPTTTKIQVGEEADGSPVYLDHHSLERTEPAPRYMRVVQTVKAFRWHYRPATYQHRVLGPAHGNGLVPTFVWRERESRKWGFIKERRGVWCWVPWKTYVYEGGKDAPCQEPTNV